MSIFGPKGINPLVRGVEGKKSQDVGQIRHLVKFARPYGWQIFGALVALMISAAAVLALGVGLRMLVDTGISGENMDLFHKSLIYLIGMVVLLAASTFGRFYLVSWLGEKVVADIRRELFKKLISLGSSFFETNKAGDLLSRITNDTTLIQTMIAVQSSAALRNFLLFIGGSTMLAITSPKLTGIVIVLVPVIIAPIIILGRSVRRRSRVSQDHVANVAAHAEEVIGAIETVQSFGNQEIQERAFKEKINIAFFAAIKRTKVRALLTAIVIVLVFSGIGLVLWMGGRDVLAGDMSGGELTAFLFYAVVVAGSVGSLSEVYGDLQHAAGSAERLADILRQKPEITDPDNPVNLPEPAEGSIEMKDITFYYPSRPEIPALSNFSMSVAVGETVAIVGPSGAGKSTIFNLLLRFFDTQSGKVHLDGVDIRDVRPSDLRERFGLVPQDPVIFASSIYDNIILGEPNATPKDVYKAAEIAGATSFIDQLPDGFNTFLGERGVRLSGGQKQRLAIARVVLKNPSIILLDEATSALDSESEKAVQEAMQRIMENCTTLVIAHSLTTVINADRIIVMQEGRIVASGTHNELILERGGLYERLAELQFRPASRDKKTN